MRIVDMESIEMTKVKPSRTWIGYKEYRYKGSVLNAFGKCIKENWFAETHAKSRKKAINNLKHQFNKSYRLANTSKLTLPGILTEIW